MKAKWLIAAAAALFAGTQAHAQTEIQFWHAMGGQLGESLNELAVKVGALDAEPSARDRDFYRGKITVAKFFADNMLPRLSAQRRIAESVDLAVMDLAEDAF